jgi:hypothetical protein
MSFSSKKKIANPFDEEVITPVVEVEAPVVEAVETPVEEEPTEETTEEEPVEEEPEEESEEDESELDALKKEIAELNGFTVMYCWSDNVENDYEKIKNNEEKQI